MTIEFHGYRPYYRERYKNNQHGVHEKEESNMIKAEWKYIKTHSFVMIVLAVLILIPSLYGVIFLSSMWDPYGKIKDLPGNSRANHDNNQKNPEPFFPVNLSFVFIGITINRFDIFASQINSSLTVAFYSLYTKSI